MVAAQRRLSVPADPLWSDPDFDVDASEARADVAGAIRLALTRLAPVMASHGVRIDVAAPSGLEGRMRGSVLADILEDFLAAAIHGAPAGRLLLTAATHGERIYIGITDDRAGTDPAIRDASIRGLMERVALRGGSLDINVRPNEGTTMTLRLAAVPRERQARRDEARPDRATHEVALSAGATGFR